MENQVELIKRFRKIARFNEYQVRDIEKWLGLSKNHFYEASKGNKGLEHAILNKMRKKIELFEETGRFKLFDRPREFIDYDLLHEIDKEYMNDMGSWDPKAYDDPRTPFILYYEGVAND